MEDVVCGRGLHAGPPEAGEEGAAVVVADLADLVEEVEVARLVLGDRRLDVLVVRVPLQLLQVLVVRAVIERNADPLLFHIVVHVLRIPSDAHVPECQAELDVSLGGDLDGLGGEDVDLVPEEPPAGEAVPVVGEVAVVQRRHVHRQDVLAPLRRHHVTWFHR